MFKISNFILFIMLAVGISISVSFGTPEDTKQDEKAQKGAVLRDKAWFISALPGSIRLNPVSGKIIEDRQDIYKMRPLGNLLERNWIYDGDTVRLHAARGEYVSFQLVVGRAAEDTLKDIFVEMAPFSRAGKTNSM